MGSEEDWNLVKELAQRVVNKVYLDADHQSCILWGSKIAGPILFNIFINALDNYVGYNCMKFAEQTKVWEVANKPDGFAAMQKDIDRLEKWDSKKLIKLNREKHEVLYLT